LENPPLLVVSDLQTIEVHTNFTNSVKRVSTFTLDDLLDPENLDQLRRVWTDLFSFSAAETPENVTEQAAREFARLAEGLRQRGEDPDRAAHFLIRLLFCLFAEDVRVRDESSSIRHNVYVGTLINPTNLRKRSFAPLLQRAGLAQIRFHDLRHTCATLLLGRNVHPKYVQELWDHATVAITLDTYSHVIPWMGIHTARAMEDVFS
jgi:hypothetical protein